jgi:hypothetical protein
VSPCIGYGIRVLKRLFFHYTTMSGYLLRALLLARGIVGI